MKWPQTKVEEFGLSIQTTVDLGTSVGLYEAVQECISAAAQAARDHMDYAALHGFAGCPNGEEKCWYCKPSPIETHYCHECGRPYDED